MTALALVHRVQTRFRLRDLLAVLAAALAMLAAATVLGALLPGGARVGSGVGLVASIAIVIAGAIRARSMWTTLRTAGAIEARVPGLDNLLVTAVELAERPDRASIRMRGEVERQAAERAAGISPPAMAPLTQPAVTLALVALSTGALLWSFMAPADRLVTTQANPIGGVAAFTRLSATVTPPSYLGRPPESFENPDQVTMIAGSRLRFELVASSPLAWMEDPAAGAQPLSRAGEGAYAIEWIPSASSAVAFAAGATAGVAEHSRVVLINVVPDRAPRVRIQKPGRDLAFSTPQQAVDVTIEADDPEGLHDLELRYTRMSGSGESFEFAEGRVPVQVHRASATRWTATTTWPLGRIGLEDGDAVVYRAMVRDTNPSADWVPSESFTIDVGKRLEFAGAGFAVPDEDRRYAVSQQMVIMKTERLQAERGRHSADDWAEQTRFLAIEQRMVRSEVVFLSGGEVEDEVEEAAHSDELQEGRLENAGRAEMLRAINEMSRAEARLNAGDTVEALVFERAALKALQRAFDRRRYFLRTMPERARIDTSRRLSGDRQDARSFARPSAPDAPDAVAAERALMSDLMALAGPGQSATPAVLARLAQFHPADPLWRKTVATLASATTPEDRRAAAAAAMNLVAASARTKLAPSAGPDPDRSSEWQGWWADEVRSRRPR